MRRTRPNAGLEWSEGSCPANPPLANRSRDRCTGKQETLRDRRSYGHTSSARGPTIERSIYGVAREQRLLGDTSRTFHYELLLPLRREPTLHSRNGPRSTKSRFLAS